MHQTSFGNNSNVPLSHHQHRRARAINFSYFIKQFTSKKQNRVIILAFIVLLIIFVAVAFLASRSISSSSSSESTEVGSQQKEQDTSRIKIVSDDAKQQQDTNSSSSALGDSFSDSKAEQQQQQGNVNNALNSKLLLEDCNKEKEKLNSKLHQVEGQLIEARRILAQKKGIYSLQNDQNQNQRQQQNTKPTYYQPPQTTPEIMSHYRKPLSEEELRDPLRNTAKTRGENSIHDNQEENVDEESLLFPTKGQKKSPNAPKIEDPFEDLNKKLKKQKNTNNQNQNNDDSSSNNYNLLNSKRRDLVRETFLEAFRAYQHHAWGKDELRPGTRGYHNWGKRNINGLGLTIFDSLSTMILMGGCEIELRESIKFIEKEAERLFDQDMGISVFETTIRVIGSLLSAYELTHEQNPALLGIAKRIADKLLFAFNTSSGLPHQRVNLKTHEHWNSEWLSNAAVLSEFGSIQLEFRTLSFHLKDPIYDQMATHIMSVIRNRCHGENENKNTNNNPDRESPVLCATFANIEDAQFRGDKISIGALGDSYYEYLLKQYLLTGGTENVYGEMAQQTLDEIIRRLLRYSNPSKQAYLILIEKGIGVGEKHEMDHLTCFAGGMFALASKELGNVMFPGTPSATTTSSANRNRAKKYLKVAEDLTTTCYEMYLHQDTGLSPDSILFQNGGDDFINNPEALHYVQRPEAIEAMFYLWRVTKKEKYRTWAWKIFLSIRKYCREEKSNGGYSGLKDVTKIPPERDNLQQTFFFAETLKYLFLIFSDDSVLDLNEWVLNTEAHPLRIRKRNPFSLWKEWEMKQQQQENSQQRNNLLLPRWTPPFVQDLKTPRAVEQIYETEGQKYHRRGNPAMMMARRRQQHRGYNHNGGGEVVETKDDPLSIPDPHLDDE